MMLSEERRRWALERAASDAAGAVSTGPAGTKAIVERAREYEAYAAGDPPTGSDG